MTGGSANIGSVTYRGGAAVTTSNSTPDPAGPFDAIEATTGAGLTKVTTIDGSVLSVYLVLGIPKTLAVAFVWTTGTSATGILGYKGATGSVGYPV